MLRFFFYITGISLQQKGEEFMKKSPVKHTAKPIPVGIGLGLALAWFISIIGVGVTALLIHSEAIPENGMGYGIVITLIVACIIGALFSVSKIQRLRLQMAMLFGVVYYLSLLGTNALFFGGQYSGMGVTALVVFGACSAVAFMGLSGGKTRKFNGLKKVYR